MNKNIKPNRSFKIISRSTKTGRQDKKRVYTSEKDFNTYKDDLIKRYSRYRNVEVYELIEEEWILIESFKAKESNPSYMRD